MQKAGHQVMGQGGMNFGLGTDYIKEKNAAQRQRFNSDLNQQI